MALRGAALGFPQAAIAINYAALGWESKRIDTEPAGTKFNHANFSGELGGVGQTGYRGAAIWMTSGHHTKAARSYAGQSGKYFVMSTIAPLQLAVLDEPGNQVFPDELLAWKDAAAKHELDGVKTVYGDFEEVVLFDRAKLAHVDTQSL